MTVFVEERVSAGFWLRVVSVSPLWPTVDNISSGVFGIYQFESCLYFVRDVSVKLAQVDFGDSSWERLLRAS
jgi:hypothetical protein